VIPLDERHLMRLSLAYVRYYDDRTHTGLNKETPGARPTESQPDVARAPGQRRGSAVCIAGTLDADTRWRIECRSTPLAAEEAGDKHKRKCYVCPFGTPNPMKMADSALFGERCASPTFSRAPNTHA
jgi:hypothetical protein